MRRVQTTGLTVRLTGHAIRWKMLSDDQIAENRQQGYGRAYDLAYEPFEPDGPWTVMCECGEWALRARTRREGQDAHRRHKQDVRAGRWPPSGPRVVSR